MPKTEPRPSHPHPNPVSPAHPLPPRWNPSGLSGRLFPLSPFLRPYLNVTIWLLAASSGFRRPMPVIV